MQPNRIPSQTTIFRQTCSDVWQGSIMGIGVSLLNPFFYAKNMRMIAAPFNLRHCFRGTIINAATSIPQSAVQIATIRVVKNLFFTHSKDDRNPYLTGITTACAAGAFSSLITVPVELIVQNVQKSQHEGLNSQKTFRRVVRINGPMGLFSGGWALTGREAVYVASYFILAGKVSDFYAHFFGNSRTTEICGAGTAGAIGGAVTTPLDTLRALKHDQAVVRKPESYWKLINRSGLSCLFRGVAERSLAIGLACIVMSQGEKFFNKE